MKSPTTTRPSREDYIDNERDLTKEASENGQGFFHWNDTINERNWSKSFPYQLAILDTWTPTAYSIYENTVFTLPINPEEMTISTPFAITTQATLGGIVEQHGGAPFRQIAFSGTFGVLPSRHSGETLGVIESGLKKFGAITGGALDGTTQAVGNLVDAATSLGDGGFRTNQYEDDQVPEHGTGYYQFHRLQRFLESYVELKKQGNDLARRLRLALLIWKDDAAYIVTPRAFNVSRTAASPYEYRYQLTLQAWRRIPVSYLQAGYMVEDVVDAKVRSPGWFKQALNKAEQARRTVAQARNVITSVRADFETTAVTGLRSLSLFLKEVGGAAKAAHDFPSAMRRTWAKAVVGEWDRIKANFKAIDPTLNDQVAKVDREVADIRSGAKTQAAFLTSLLASPDATDFQALIDPDTLPLSNELRAAADDEVRRVAALTTEDFRAMEAQLLGFAADYADRVGMGSVTYNATLGRSTSPKQREATFDDIAALDALLDIAQVMGALSLQSDADTGRALTTIEYVAGLASEGGLSMRVPKSKFAVPFPYGSTLMKLARDYLGDAERWGEIAALNDLRAPWVDEVGTRRPLVVNGRGNQVVVSDASTLALGQVVTLASKSVLAERRRVVEAKAVADGTWVVTVDGAADLKRFTTLDAAYLHSYLAGTVNSGRLIYIPSDTSPEEEVRYAPDAHDVAAFLTAGVVDGMLTESGDLVITPDGDWPYVYGLAALVQYARVALSTSQGSMPLHPNFGLSVRVGDSLADSSAESVVAEVKAMFKNTPPFTGVKSIVVERVGPVTRIAMELGVRGSDVLLPVSFEVRR